MTLDVTQAITIQQLPSPIISITSTAIPLQLHDSTSPDAFEIIVGIWDGVSSPSSFYIPTIHIWKDGYAMWVDRGIDQVYHIYETFLSTDEIMQAESTISRADFWAYEGPTVQIPDATVLTIWVNQSEREKSLALRYAPQFETMVSSLRDTLEASSTKTEYFPKQGYIYTSKAASYLEDNGFAWPDDQLNFDFSKSEQGSLIDGPTLSALWQITQQNYFWITSRGIPYKYELRIPGLTCLYTWDETKHEWQYKLFEFESR